MKLPRFLARAPIAFCAFAVLATVGPSPQALAQPLPNRVSPGFKPGLRYFAAAAPTLVTRQAVRMLGPGHSTGTGVSTGNGSPVALNRTFTNLSGAPITDISLVFSGWFLATNGTTAVGNDYDVTSVTVEYPSGTTVCAIQKSGSGTITVTNGTSIATDICTVSTPIPAGSTFAVKGTSTVVSPSKYSSQDLGLTGVRTTLMSDTPGLKRAVLYAVGDSVVTNNGSAPYNALSGRGPGFQASIAGTTAQTYASGANFDRQLQHAQLLGATRILSNWSSNDAIAGRSAAQIQGDIATLRGKANAMGIAWDQATMIPRLNTTNASVAISSLTYPGSGVYLTAVVPDASRFVVGMPYVVQNAGSTGYNGTVMVTARDLSANTLTLLAGSTSTIAVSPSVGSPTITGWRYSSRSLQRTASTAFDAGGSSLRGLFNAWVRTPSNVDGVVELGDAFEVTRDDGVFVIGGDKAKLLIPQLVTATSSFINASNFSSTYSGASNTINGAFIMGLTGANAGVYRDANGNTGNVITSQTAWPSTPIAGDTYWVVTTSTSATADAVHPALAGGNTGGQQLLEDVMASYVAGIM